MSDYGYDGKREFEFTLIENGEVVLAVSSPDDVIETTVERFKMFLAAVGYGYETIERIQLADNDPNLFFGRR